MNIVTAGRSFSPRDLKAAARPTAQETHRPEVQDQIRAVESLLETSLNNALSALPHIRSRENVREVVSTILSVREEWGKTKHAAVETGKLLIRLRREAEQDYDTLFDETRYQQPLMPFSASVESKLRRIAEAVMDQRITVDELPVAYSAAYEIVTLPDDQIEAVKTQGLLQPSTSRSQILEFKKTLVSKRAASTNDSPRDLRNKKKKLNKELTNLLRRVDRVRDDLAEIEARLNPKKEEMSQPGTGDGSRTPIPESAVVGEGASATAAA